MVHCLALPILLAAVPAISAIVAIPESFHRWVLLFAAPAAAIALVSGYARHAAPLPLGVGAIGIGLMALGAFGVPEGPVEIGMTMMGARWLRSRTSPTCDCAIAVRSDGISSVNIGF